MDPAAGDAGTTSAAIRAAARRVEDVATQIRDAVRVATSVHAVAWESLAAEEFRRRVAEEVARLQVVAAVVDDAARALSRHARAVEGAPW